MFVVQSKNENVIALQQRTRVTHLNNEASLQMPESRARTIALLYNDVPEEGDDGAPASPVDVSPEALGFTPYFDIEDVSVAEEFAQIHQALVDAGYRVISYNVKDRFDRLFRFLANRKVDLVFNLIEYFNGRPEQETHVASFFELIRLPYTGAPPMALALCQNKTLAKEILRLHNLPTPRSFTIRTMAEFPSEHTLHYPLIVKPASEDGSGGIENESIVTTLEALRARVEHVIVEYKMDALVEEYIEGRELNVAVLGNGSEGPSRRRVLPISEIVFADMPEHLYKIVSYQAKWEPLHEAYHKTIASCPADLPAETTARAQAIALRAANALEVRDYARVDMRLDAKGDLYILEVNPNPNLSEGTGIARSAEADGMTFSALLGEIVESALARTKGTKQVSLKSLVGKPSNPVPKKP